MLPEQGTTATPRGRLAPSPTGCLHIGNARSFLLAWLQMRALGGEIILRIEDIDQARAVAGAEHDIVEDLHWLGLDWDNELTTEYFQSSRTEFYQNALSDLQERGLVYECYCSRKELREAMSAPHGADGSRYPGTCRGLTRDERLERSRGKDPALRFTTNAGDVVEFTDLIAGRHVVDVHEVTGDFIVARADGFPGYQLGVVLDDIAMGITHVLRGDDLLDSTPRQLLLYRALQATPPTYAHVPLVLDANGVRLAKRTGAVTIAELRESGRSAEEIIGWLAWSCGLQETKTPCSATTLIPTFIPGSIITASTRIAPDETYCELAR